MKKQSELQSIQERNKRVELDKAWETSKTRRAIIAVMTYIIVVFFLWLIHAPNIFLNAIVPVVGFILSTLTLSWCKKKWMENK
ncbi:hypothetical protein HZA99_03645 [Candidatus Woesearchaeota archaeon]|nr:hypothetical protein [Candidatus Woesearchaeota archaeon]